MTFTAQHRIEGERRVENETHGRADPRNEQDQRLLTGPGDPSPRESTSARATTTDYASPTRSTSTRPRGSPPTAPWFSRAAGNGPRDNLRRAHARESNHIYTSREDLGHAGIDNDAIDRLAERARESRAQKGEHHRDQHGRTRRATGWFERRVLKRSTPDCQRLPRPRTRRRARPSTAGSPRAGPDREQQGEHERLSTRHNTIIATPARSPRSNTPTKASNNATTREQMTTRSATDYATPSRNATISKQTRRSAPANDYVKHSNGRPHTNATTTAATASRSSTPPAPAAGSSARRPVNPGYAEVPLTTLVTAAPLRSFLDSESAGADSRPEPKGWSAGFVSPTVSRLRRFLRVVQRT